MMVRVLILGLLLGTVGCATGYHARGLGGGFSETQLDLNVFQVRFRGNGYTSQERATDFALLRSAELARKNGFEFFIIADRGDETRSFAHTTPTESYTTGTASVVGNTAYVNANTTTYGGQTYVIRKPALVNTVVCFKERPEGRGFVYNATFVYESLTQKYGIDRH